ncbi:MAG: hypothetical protein IPN59_15140 [Holophaga sp.]|nr:hypothetical protein [Holophaga sp.]
MTTPTGKAPKKAKAKAQTPEERMKAMQYNQMMYGPTAGELRPVIKKIDFGAAYIKHPKFQSLMTAFKNGSNFNFTVSDKNRSYNISTDGEHIFFEGKVVFYSRSLNKFERNLLLDRLVMRQFKTIDAFVHLAFAVLRALPELEKPLLTYRNNEFFLNGEELGIETPEHGPNLMVGSYKINIGKVK